MFDIFKKFNLIINPKKCAIFKLKNHLFKETLDLNYH
jgi:hypothetical protein